MKLIKKLNNSKWHLKISLKVILMFICLFFSDKNEEFIPVDRLEKVLDLYDKKYKNSVLTFFFYVINLRWKKYLMTLKIPMQQKITNFILISTLMNNLVSRKNEKFLIINID